MPTDRRLAIIAGSLYLVTFVTSIPALALTTAFISGAADASFARWAAVLEIVLALSCVGTAIAIYPVARRYNPVLALGFVGSRVLEASLVLTGVLALLSIATLRAGSGGGEVESALVALHDAAFLVGPGLLPAANALLLATLLYRARLVPRVIALVGIIGAPLLAASAFATLFGLIDQVSPIAGAAALPIALWEFSVGVWLVLRGLDTRSTVFDQRITGLS